MDDLERLANFNPSYHPTPIPYLPHEILTPIFSHLYKEDLKSLRTISPNWTYHPSLLTLLFNKPLSIILTIPDLDAFITTFASSPVKHLFRHVEFGLSRFFMCRCVARRVEMMRDGKGVDDDGCELGDVKVMTEGLEVYGEEGRSWWECQQPEVLGWLVRFFECVPQVRKVDILCFHRFGQVPVGPRVCNCGTGYIDSVRYRISRELNPLCRAIYLDEWRRGKSSLSPRVYETRELVRSGQLVNQVLPGIIYQALGLSNTHVEDVWVEWMGNEVHTVSMWNDWIGVINSYFVPDKMDDALVSLKTLRITFCNHTTNTTEQSLARLQLLRRSHNLETLYIAWADNTWYCFHDSDPHYIDIASNLIDISSLVSAPLFPHLRSLTLDHLSCQAAELLHLISSHCRILRALTLETVQFIHRPPAPPDCWVKFLKDLKRNCGNRLEQLEITGGICNSSQGLGGPVQQHWHVCKYSPYHGAPKDGWIRDRVLGWFHDPEQTDEMCPLNLWELVQGGKVLRGREDDFDDKANDGLLYWSWDDASWEDGEFVDCTDENPGFRLYD